ncbi:unnamed protein product [Bemisia tabaci]|uniref:DNA-directed primase/polymerase protein n=1 Tax=Bemisia tabaci TaxID=7038 RepID=A0A9P0A604_BEMTA|nr:PREDICTED: DNA-directed primase/polymerase protein-like [Bemisia tabaci]CAH0387201.1 unnamed protein product [Bemisia tabaci]
MSEFTVSVRNFYGDNNYKANIFDVKCDEHSIVCELPPNLTRILGPSNVWKIFKKQSELLEYLSFKARNLNLMPFVFQSINNERLFLAAHPLVFWYYDSHRKTNQRHSYEIIRENHPCKLYFDLEFCVNSNPAHNGDRMVSTFLKIVIFMIKVPCSFNDVLDLDSSTSSKFSHHLIFQLPNHVFQTNYHAGYFVEKVCHEILANIHGEDMKVDLKCECNVSKEELSELLVKDAKGNSVLFCDRSVYSKNRHFRLYKSSKLGKETPLEVSANNKFCVNNSVENISDEQIFLASLITYFPDEHFLSNCDIISFDLAGPTSSRPKNCSNYSSQASVKSVSAFPKVDKFVQDLVAPGKIWRVLSFDENKTLVYDIVANRFCQNIGRAHKSNNIMIVVDTGKCIYYQKCHDHDCKGFRSEEKQLPFEISFYLRPDSELVRSTEDDLQLLEDDAFLSEDCLQISQEPKVLSRVTENPQPSVQEPKCSETDSNKVDLSESKALCTGNGAEPKTNNSTSEGVLSCNKSSGSQFPDEEMEYAVCQILDIIEDESFANENSNF